MVAWIPTDEVGVSRVILDEGVEVPGVRMVSHCGGAEVEISGPGRHEIEVPVEPSTDSEECQIELIPNYHLLLSASGERRTLLLESIAWSVNGRG